LASVAALGLAACNNDARISVAAQPMSTALNTSEVRYRIDAGGRQWNLTLPPIPVDVVAGRRTAGQIDTPTSGQALVSFTITLPGGREVASGSALVDLRSDWVWDFDVYAATEDPRRQCFGCVGSKAFALPEELKSAGRDSVWLVWGGNTIKHPRIY
jgi:hypothetical protein